VDRSPFDRGRGPRARPGNGRGEGGPPGGRRPPPPEATGQEAEFLDTVQAAGAPVEIHLRDGRILRGTIEQFDRDTITLERADGPPLLIRKPDIRYVSAGDETPAR
jgi:sRNA-binding regulator protein Hfq